MAVGVVASGDVETYMVDASLDSDDKLHKVVTRLRHKLKLQKSKAEAEAKSRMSEYSKYG